MSNTSLLQKISSGEWSSSASVMASSSSSHPQSNATQKWPRSQHSFHQQLILTGSKWEHHSSRTNASNTGNGPEASKSIDTPSSTERFDRLVVEQNQTRKTTCLVRIRRPRKHIEQDCTSVKSKAQQRVRRFGTAPFAMEWGIVLVVGFKYEYECD